MKKVGIYKITSPSGRIYIGQSRNIDKRWSAYKDLKVNKHPRLHNSFLKYGLGTHIFEIIEECDFLSLNIKERHWQDFYNTTGEKGLNCTLTATDVLPRVISEETRKKLRDSKIGDKNHRYGKVAHNRNLDRKESKKEVAKKVIDTSTGIIYKSAAQAAGIFKIKTGTLNTYLLGKRPNKTTLLYLQGIEQLNKYLNG